MCIKQSFLPPVKPQIENYFTAFPLECFIRRMIKVVLFHIDFTLVVALFTENGCQIGYYGQKLFLDQNLKV